MSSSKSTPIRAVPSRRAPTLTRSASEVLPRLWLSGRYTAVNEEQLVAIGVTHIVSILERRPKYPAALKKQLKTLHIPLQDGETADILQHFDTTTAFIKSALEDKRNTVLVHCAMGISRSATVVSAYLVATTSMQPHEAIEFVQSKREIVSPNLAFRRQLDAYASPPASASSRATSGPRRSARISLLLDRRRGDAIPTGRYAHARETAAGRGVCG
ncbi:hypothetical protein GSI_12547 [Ganoderma sinense ZZ0214-1]|uniref:Uncharacterized protein n=1 Tax=Ganoderma sinense ZZ0214-1 TaxID=1077348 RepID=A0A2G8RT42_9APHY|nr:hypothetical protein GSI_12547 [Ganoderma sinense ZZ0214-1]